MAPGRRALRMRRMSQSGSVMSELTRAQRQALADALLGTPGDRPGDDDLPGPDVWALYMVDAMLAAAGIAVEQGDS